MVRDEATAFAFCAALLGATPARSQTVTWFERNPQDRAAVIRSCENDHALAGTRACLNARAAETRAYGRRSGRVQPPAIQEQHAPFVQDAIRNACARPPSQRGLLAAACTRKL